MIDEPTPIEKRRAALNRFIAQRIKRGYRVVSLGDTAAELFKPAGFPYFLRKDKTLFVVVDEKGKLWVRKRQGSG